ncbi:MAG: hypothetical protein H0T42_19315 [Deltaproteobacteria bacterium]|nr:hypothetical protein [Deltaproteobacteria bacterium]
MNKLLGFLALSFSGSLIGGCAGDEDLTLHEVCSRISDAECGRAAVCEPTVNQDGCFAKAMARCCPDGVCDEIVIADEPRLAACERAVETMSCSDLDNGDMPSACENLDTKRPTDDPPSDDPPSDVDPATNPGVLEVNWQIDAGSSTLSCNQFHGATKLRIHATNPSGGTITREFACSDASALTHLPIGPFSIRADLRDASGQVIQETTAQTVVLNTVGVSVYFTFQVTTRFGAFCTQLADKICATCAPTDTTCKVEMYNGCCGDAGTCNRPALAEPAAWNQCLAGWGSGQYCTAGAGSPAVCSGSVDVF